MTFTYSPYVFTSKGFGTFLKLLFNWKASIYKLVWRELMVYIVLYSGKKKVLEPVRDNAAKRTLTTQLVPLGYIQTIYGD